MANSFVGKIDSRAIKDIARKVANFKAPITKEDAENVGKGVVEEMKNLITKGISPIEGNGRFESYKNPKSYPGKRKPKTPVNLYLSGDFLDALSYSVVKGGGGYATKIFYRGKEEIKEQGHREGANGQRKRPTIPIKSGETFAVRIQRVFADIYNARIKLISKSG